jgi:tetratricopeptide (TPR) repeat protein
MNLIPTKPSPHARVLILLAIVSMTSNCHHPQSQLGSEGAAVAHVDAGNSNAAKHEPEAAQSAVGISAPQAASSRPQAKHERTRTQQSFAIRDADSATTVAVLEEYASALKLRPTALSADVSEAPSGPTEPAELIARASELIIAGNRPRGTSISALSGAVPFSVSSTLRTVYYRSAAEIAQRAVELLKQQQVPTQPAAKEKYSATLLAAMSVRAEALGLLAAQDRLQGKEAETAYREYLATEPDDAKRASAEYKLAAMLYQLEELEKAKQAYELLLARNEDDARALAALVQIHRRIAATQQTAGDNAEAKANLRLAQDYSDRLRDSRSPNSPDVRAKSGSEGVKGRNVDERVNADRKRANAEPAERKKRQAAKP